MFFNFNNSAIWAIEYTDSPEWLDKDKHEVGATYFNLHRIYIQADMGAELTRETIIHEITHAALHSYGIKKDNYSEEELCEFLALHLDEIINKTNDFLQGGTA